jgi:hypothetical protein
MTWFSFVFPNTALVSKQSIIIDHTYFLFLFLSFFLSWRDRKKERVADTGKRVLWIGHGDGGTGHRIRQPRAQDIRLCLDRVSGLRVAVGIYQNAAVSVEQRAVSGSSCSLPSLDTEAVERESMN